MDPIGLDGTSLGLVESFGDKVNLLGLTNGAVGGVPERLLQ